MKIGIIIANLGTPSNYDTKSIKKYLYEFLKDPRVIDVNPFIWKNLLKFVILPKRAPKVSHLYKNIWTPQGSPLMDITLKQRKMLDDQLKLSYPEFDFYVEVAMSYGHPNIKEVTSKLLDKKLDKIILLPMYPQYSSTTTMPLIDAFNEVIKARRDIPEFHLIHNYRNNSNYIQALSNSIYEYIKTKNTEDFFSQDTALLISYHGLPQRYVKELGDSYYDQCMDTTKSLNDVLKIKYTNIFMTFQSVFGSEIWLKPYTDETIESLGYKGIKKLYVICPGFSVDCLETLEEINIEARKIFLENQGVEFHYIHCLNDRKDHILAIEDIIKKYF